MTGGKERARPAAARLTPARTAEQAAPWKKYAPALIAALAAVLLAKPLARLIFQVGLGALIALIAKPIAVYIERKLPRGASCVVALMTLLLASVGIVALVIPPLITQLRTAADMIPTVLKWAERTWASMQTKPLFAFLNGSGMDIGSLITKSGAWVTEKIPHLIKSIANIADKMSTALIAPVLSYYFLRDRELFGYQVSLLIPFRHRAKMLEAMKDMKRETGAYVRGQMLTALAVGALTAAGLAVIGVPAWLVLGTVMGICEAIPYVGPLLGSIPILLMALTKGPGILVWALVITVAVQQLESMVIAPRMMSGATGLHPVQVLMLLTAGSLLFGLWGLLLSLPAFICLRSVMRTFLSRAA